MYRPNLKIVLNNLLFKNRLNNKCNERNRNRIFNKLKLNEFIFS